MGPKQFEFVGCKEAGSLSHVRNRTFIDRPPLTKLKLQEMAEKEKRAQVGKNTPLLNDDGFAGEGKPGLFDPNEPRPVHALRARMRVLHHPISTENTYADSTTRTRKRGVTHLRQNPSLTHSGWDFFC